MEGLSRKDCSSKANDFRNTKEEIKKKEKTGHTQQDYIGTFDDSPIILSNNRFDLTIFNYYINMTIMNSGNKKRHFDHRILNLSYMIWDRWFKSGKI